jgi:nitric oxide reductase
MYHHPFATARTEYSQIVRAVQGIIASNQAANRDPGVFDNPNVFNMFRKRGTEEGVGFGCRDNRCIAEGLARTELEAVFGESAVM